MFDIFAVLLVVWFVSGIIGACCGNENNRGLAGFVLGFLLGPFGVIAALLLPPKPLSGTASGNEELNMRDLKAILQLRGKVGIRLADDALTVLSLAEGSSAQRAGVLPNDRVVMIDDRLATGDFMENILRLSGQKGTDVQVVVRRGEDGHEFTLVRE